MRVQLEGTKERQPFSHAGATAAGSNTQRGTIAKRMPTRRSTLPGMVFTGCPRCRSAHNHAKETRNTTGTRARTGTDCGSSGIRQKSSKQVGALFSDEVLIAGSSARREG